MSLLCTLAVLILVAGNAGPALAHSGGDECAALGGLVISGECRITGPASVSDQLHGGSFTIKETVHVTASGSLLVRETAGGSSLTLNITGGLIMDTGALIVGDATTSAGVGAAITINATGDIVLHGNGTTGALISSNHLRTCATVLVTSGKNAAGNITLDTAGDVIAEAASAITANSTCRAGEIRVVAGGSTRIDGLISAEGTSTNGRGGPITVNAGCDLSVGSTGMISSKGRDPGADLVHLEGGCAVAINGLVQSTGPGHQHQTDRLCHAPERPDKPAQSPACVEVWSGGTIAINSAFPGKGEINADSAQAGATLCCGWVDLYATGQIQINGDGVAPYSIHANQDRASGYGGYITLKSTQDSVWIRGLAIQGVATLAGGDGGKVTIEASGNVRLDESQVVARGDDASAGGYGIGGRIAARSFNGSLTWKNLSGGVLATGDVRPTGMQIPAAQRGTVGLGYCTSVSLTGTSFPANGTATTPGSPTLACGGEPPLPSYVILPSCACGLAQPDVSVTKSAGTPVVVAGGIARYDITVMANGTDDSRNVALTDSLPGGLAWVVSGPDSGACSMSSAVLTCAFGTMAPGTSRTISLSATTNTSSCPSLFNTAMVAADQDVDGSNNVSGPVAITVNCPDVSVAKSTSTPTVMVGGNAVYRIVVTAGGTGTSTNVRLSDSLPTGLAWTVGGTDAASCSIAGGVLSCNFGAMTQGSSRSITLTAPTTPARCGNITNTATVTADVDANTTNSKSATVTIVIRCPDVRVTKTAAVSTITAGATASYIMTVTSGGSGNSDNVTLTDQLPSGLVWTITGGTGAASCSISGGTNLSCNFGTITQGSSKSVAVSATTSASNCPSITNVAATVSATINTSTANDTAGPVKITVTCPDVSVTKSTSTPSITAGQTASYTIRVTAGGSASATNVVLTDTLPGAGLTWTKSGTDAALCTITGSVLSCNFGTMAVGTFRTVTVSATTSTANCPSLVNQATVSASVDADSGNNTSAPVTITVNCPQAPPDASVSKSTTTPIINAGQTASYTMTVTATGGGNSNDVTLGDTLPGTGLTWALAGGTGAGFCTITSGNSLSCPFGTMAPGTSWTVTVSATTTTGSCPSLVNQAFVSATTDTNVGNNSSAPVTITVNCPQDPPDASVTKSTTTPIVTAGQAATYTMTVSATGSSNSENVTLSDALPGTSLIWAVTGGTGSSFCTITTGNSLSCPFGTMSPGTSLTVTVSATTTTGSCPSLTNQASVSATTDTDLSNNTSAPVTITVDCPDVSVTKSTTTPSITAGQTASYTMTVSATGGTNVYDVTLSDTLPGAGLTWAVTGGTGAGFCTITSGNSLSCPFGTMASGASWTVMVSATTTAANCPSLTNQAFVSAATDIDSSNNTSTPVTITVNCPQDPPDVSLTKSTTTPTINAGDLASYTITVTATGSGPSTNVTLTDHLPGGGLNWSVSGADAGVCQITTDVNGDQTLTCPFGTMAAGTSKTVTVSAVTNSTSCPMLSNTATVSANGDGNVNNNSSSPISIAVACQAGVCALPNSFFNLGAAASYTALGLNGADWNIGTSATYIQGNVGVAANAVGSIIKATIDGSFVVDPGVNTASGLSIHDDLNVTGTAYCDSANNTICDQPPTSVATAASNATSASTTLAGLTPTQTLGNVTGATGGVTRTASVNVVQINSLSLGSSETFTITGNAGDVFVFNVVGSAADAFSVRGSSQIVLAGGIPERNVLWNFPGNGGDVVIKDPKAVARGIFLAPTRTIIIDKATLHGATIGAGSPASTFTIHSAATVLCSTGAVTCDTSIGSNFNGTAISSGRYIWFNSVVKVSGLGANPVTIHFNNPTINFTANSTAYNLTAPNAVVTFSPSATSATTMFDSANNRWVTTVPSSLGGNMFLTGLPFLVPANFPGGINPVTWSGTFTSDAPGVTINWQWAAAVYASFSSDPSQLGVKPVDDKQASVYQNSDHAGTPESFKSFVIGGARGGGGSNYTGSYSATKSCDF